MKTIDILSVGDVNIEVTLAGLPSMPKLGREILAENAYRTLGGSTVNTAVGLARLGLRSGFVGKVESISQDGKKVTVLASVFGRDTAVELDTSSVALAD